MKCFLILILLLSSHLSFARDGDNRSKKADGWITINKSNVHFKQENGIPKYKIKSKNTNVWVRSQQYLEFKLNREDILFEGVSYAPYSNTIVIYFSELTEE